jgi:hypothetical protein
MSALALHIRFRERGFRWPLRDDDAIEVWSSGHALIVTLSGAFMRHLVELHVAGAVVGQELQALVRKPAAILPSPRNERERRRLQRRSRRRRV